MFSEFPPIDLPEPCINDFSEEIINKDKLQKSLFLMRFISIIRIEFAPKGFPRLIFSFFALDRRYKCNDLKYSS